MNCSILGCGWLGIPLAKRLVQEKKSVKGSTTSEKKAAVLKSLGIRPFLLRIENNQLSGNLDAFLKSDALVICVPYRHQKNNFNAYQNLAKAIEKSSIRKVVFISSTSVYADCNGPVSESENPRMNPEKQGLIDLENLFLQNPHFRTNILRFAGLIGGTRHPGTFFQEGRTVENGSAPVNLIHLEDCVRILCQMLEGKHWNHVFNAATDSHPKRKDFYTAAAKKLGKKPALFLDNIDGSYKIISNEKLKTHYGYSFVHNDLMAWVRSGTEKA